MRNFRAASELKFRARKKHASRRSSSSESRAQISRAYPTPRPQILDDPLSKINRRVVASHASDTDQDHRHSSYLRYRSGLNELFY